MNDSKAVPAAGMHRAKTWEIGFYALNNTSTNTYMMMMMYVSYLVGGLWALDSPCECSAYCYARMGRCDGSDHRVHGRQDERQAGEEPSFHHHRKFDLDGVLVHYVFCGPGSCRRILCSACCFSL